MGRRGIVGAVCWQQSPNVSESCAHFRMRGIRPICSVASEDRRVFLCKAKHVDPSFVNGAAGVLGVC